MDVLLINPNREQLPWPLIPVGLAAVATAAHRAGHAVDLLDLVFSSKPAAEVRRALRRRQPRVVGIGIRNLDNCNMIEPVFYPREIRDEIVATVRACAPSAVLVIGGSGVNVAPHECLRFLAADYALVGEGERSFVAFLDTLGAGDSPDGLPGVLAAGDASSPGQAPDDPPSCRPPRVADLDTLGPTEAWRWLDMRRYARSDTPYPIQTKRGCTAECSYCVYRQIEGDHYRLRPPRDVVEEIAAAHGRGVESFEFVDSTFDLPEEHTCAVCDELAARALPITVTAAGLNPRGVTADVVAALKRGGFESVMCTPDSASSTTLRSLAKGFDVDTIAHAVDLLHGAALPTCWFFLLGAPGETPATVSETLRFCAEHIPADHLVMFSTGIRVYAGTALARHCRDVGWFAADDPLFFPSWYSSPDCDMNELYRLLIDGVLEHPNWMLQAEPTPAPTTAALLKRTLRLLGGSGAFWRYLPKLYALRTRLGERQRSLARVAARVAHIRDIAHRR